MERVGKNKNMVAQLDPALLFGRVGSQHRLQPADVPADTAQRGRLKTI